MRWRLTLCGIVMAGGAIASSEPPPAAPVAAASGETVQQALCRLIESSARARGLPADFFTRLIWAESSFRTGVVSPAGAQGVAQFMPGTAAERGLADPFDPEQAIPKAAELLRDHLDRFGNLGLAAAAYNGGPNRVASWLVDSGGLPAETRAYVLRITGRTAEDWAAERRGRTEPAPDTPEGGESQPKADGGGTEAGKPVPSASCLQVVALLRRGRDDLQAGATILEAALAPWGVQLSGNFSKSLALAAFERARRSYATVLGDVRPMVIGTRLRSRGSRAFYRVRVPATTRAAADGLCSRIRRVGGACVVLPS